MDRLPLHREAFAAISEIFGSTPAHRRLYGRVLALSVIVVAADLLGAVAVYCAERGVTESQTSTTGVWRSLVWSSSQLTVGGSSLSVTTPGGHAIELALGFLAVTAVAALAGSLAAFFHGRDLTRSRSLETPRSSSGAEPTSG